MRNLPWHILRRALHPFFPDQIAIWKLLVFVWRKKKPEDLAKNLGSKDENQQQSLNSLFCVPYRSWTRPRKRERGRESSETGLGHLAAWWETSASITARHPCTDPIPALHFLLHPPPPPRQIRSPYIPTTRSVALTSLISSLVLAKQMYFPASDLRTFLMWRLPFENCWDLFGSRLPGFLPQLILGTGVPEALQRSTTDLPTTTVVFFGFVVNVTVNTEKMWIAIINT